jgi:hypothetical protein
MIRLAIQNPKPAIKPYTKSFANIMIIIVIGSSMVLSPDVPVNEPIPNKLNEIFFTGHFLVTPFFDYPNETTTVGGSYCSASVRTINILGGAGPFG